MENKPIKEEEANQYNLLDLIPSERKWVLKSADEGSSSGGGLRNHHFCSTEKKLELRLGLPGEGEEEESKQKKREGYNGNYSRIDKFPSSSTNTLVPKSSHKRAGAVVGWPPLRSSRTKLASSSSTKPLLPPPPHPPPPPPPPPPVKAEENQAKSTYKGLFVKINMEGVPIGRKVDLRAHDNYDKLCSAVDTLFRGLLAAQMDSSSCGVQSKQEREKPITGLLDGSGEYTLVYEDNEGDRMLVGDVPWHMFVSTVKRLRVLKTSELPSLSKVMVKKESR